VGPRAGLNTLEKYLTVPGIEPWNNNIIQNLEKQVLRKWSTLIWLRVDMGSCKQGNKTSGSIKYRTLFALLSIYKLLLKKRQPWSEMIKCQ
jgi:hypothetical protein